jgi:hypothetical protein
VGRQIVQHHPDALGLRIVEGGKVAHAVGKVVCRAPLGDLDLAPGAVRVEEDEQVGGAVALISCRGFWSALTDGFPVVLKIERRSLPAEAPILFR